MRHGSRPFPLDGKRAAWAASDNAKPAPKETRHQMDKVPRQMPISAASRSVEKGEIVRRGSCARLTSNLLASCAANQFVMLPLQFSDLAGDFIHGGLGSISDKASRLCQSLGNWTILQNSLANRAVFLGLL